MTRYKLKCGGKTRRKAFLGADGAMIAAATMAAAGMTTGATIAAAKQQGDAAIKGANIQAQTAEKQIDNNNANFKEQTNVTISQNKENRQQQQDIQTSLQFLVGKENMSDRMEARKMQVKFGGKPKRKTITQPFYGGTQFQVTDGGGVIPLSVTPDGYGLYELYGNDHEHYHKTSSGKNKTGVGIKFNDGSIVEGEGNQNTNQGELLYITPNNAMFISKHNIAGFNPTKAVLNGANPEEVFAIQEIIKDEKGLNDDGSKRKKRSLKRMFGGSNSYIEQANITQNPSNGTAPVAAGVVYALNNKVKSPVENIQYNRPIAKCGGRRKLKNSGRRKAGNGTFWNNYAGATYNAIGNFAGAGLNALGNIIGSNKLSKAYNKAGNILADAYSQMHGIDLSELKMEDYAAPHSIAVIRDANNINYNAQLERARRNAAAERREINRETNSSIARQQKLAASDDRLLQRTTEISSAENAEREKIRQANANAITQTSQDNADRDVKARQNYGAAKLALLQYNNDIENSKLMGIGQARADAITQSSLARAQGLQQSMTSFGNALANSGNAFATAYGAARKESMDFTKTYVGLGNEDKVTAAILRYNQTGDRSYIDGLLESNTISDESRSALTSALNNKTRFKLRSIKPSSIRPGSILPDTSFNNGNIYYS